MGLCVCADVRPLWANLALLVALAVSMAGLAGFPCMLTPCGNPVKYTSSSYCSRLQQVYRHLTTCSSAACDAVQRSIAFAKHFASFTRVLRDVQRQQTLKQGSAQEQSAPGSPEQQADTPPFTRSSSTLDDATAAAMPLASTSSLASSAGDDDALDAAVTAAVAVPDAAALHAAAAAAVKGEEAAGAAAGSPAGGSSRMESTINLLDQLVVEQLTERAAAAGPHK